MMARNEDIDIARSLGIVLVVIGHIIQMNCNDCSKSVAFQIIYSFHMPLFFFISGYVTYRLDWNPKYDWILKKFVSLVIPYVIWFIINYSLNGYIFENGLVSVFKLMITKYDMGYWFLLSLFWCDCALFMSLMINKICIKKESLAFQILCCFVVLGFFWLLQHFVNYLGISSVWAYFPYVICGYAIAGLTKKIPNFINNIKIIVVGAISGILFWVLCVVKFSYGNMLLFESILNKTITKQLASELDSGLLAIAGIVAIFCVAFILKQFPIKDSFIYLGKHTVEIYVIHFLLLRGYVDNIYVNSSICFIMALLVPLGIEIGLRKVTVIHRLLFGR